MFSENITAEKAKKELTRKISAIKDIIKVLKNAKLEETEELRGARIYLNVRLDRLQNSLMFVKWALNEKKNFGENEYYFLMMKNAKVEFELYERETKDERKKAFLEQSLAAVSQQTL